MVESANFGESDRSPKVTVIIPTYNRAGVLYYALHSVLNQTFSDLEIYVVDDASTDETMALLESIDDPRVNYIRFETNRKSAAARNAGMEKARGEYIAFLDSDDEWWPTKLEKQVALMDSLSDEWGCSYTGAYVSKVGGLIRNTVYKPVKSGYLVKDLLMNKLVIWTSTFMFRRSCLDEIGLMDAALVRSHDIDFYVRLLEQYKIKALNEPLVNIYLILNKSLAKVSAESRAILLKKHSELIGSLGASASRYVYSMGELFQAEVFLSEGELVRGWKLFVTAVRRFPFLPLRRYLAVMRHLAEAIISPAQSG
jgi:glycosyltransferase involved in cell wall biosynthesis